MYNFIDTNEVSEAVVLPSEALQINGEYIENLIPGYRTLTVSGREALSPELTYFETGVRDGSVIQNKRFPARIIKVAYQLIAESNEAFRDAYNKLASILNVDNAELIFNDEPDKFFTGTPSAIGEVEPGKNSVIGEFEIFCADPFKYSVIEYEAESELVDGSILIDYNGTYKAFPTLVANFFNEEEASDDGESTNTLTGGGDCGYIAFFNEKEKIIQLGDPEEKDVEYFANNQTLVHNVFSKEFAWGSAAQNQWVTNTAIASPQNGFNPGGAVAICPATYQQGENLTTSGTLLTIQSKAEKPYIDYKVTAQASSRTEKTVKVKVTITASLASKDNYLRGKRGLKGSIQLGGTWYSVTIKKEGADWKGNSGHTVNLTVTVTGLEADTTLLDDIKFKVERTDKLGKSGILNETACKDLEIYQYVAPVATSWYLAPTSYSSGVGNWHGPSIKRAIPADASGEVGATEFTTMFQNRMCIGSSTNAKNQKGHFDFQVIDKNGANIAGVRYDKNTVGNLVNVKFYIGGNLMFEKKIQITTSTVFNNTIRKIGNTIHFNCGGVIKTFSAGTSKNKIAGSVAFAFQQYSATPALERNGLNWVKFIKYGCKTFNDIPNKFTTNDIVEADCKSGNIYLNGVVAPELGALGNDWEEFVLMPGLNQIGFAYSDWTEQPPTFKVRYREVFL
jgi:predicted phage tail component-like protein